MEFKEEDNPPNSLILRQLHSRLKKPKLEFAPDVSSSRLSLWLLMDGTKASDDESDDGVGETEERN